MSGETDLETLLASMRPELDDELYVFATLTSGAEPAGLAPRLRFVEAEGVSLVLPQAEAEARGLPYEFPCRMITLEVHSALAAVGFLAAVAARLAAAGIPANAVAAYHHDHLFVPADRAADAMRVLRELSAEYRGATPK